ncbi:hypothetical protein M8818_001292 [Zalaria obscura]|uniref:Uncharacterized protein n=1 Tax=Zalaria obscura TaxID=2024903 RepID=A0ACC3SKR0_9PEZI
MTRYRGWNLDEMKQQDQQESAHTNRSKAHMCCSLLPATSGFTPINAISGKQYGAEQGVTASSDEHDVARAYQAREDVAAPYSESEVIQEAAAATTARKSTHPSSTSKSTKKPRATTGKTSNRTKAADNSKKRKGKRQTSVNAGSDSSGMPVVKAARHIVEDSAKSTASLSASADQIDHQDSVSEAARRKLDSFKYDSSRGLQGNTSISVIAPETSMDVVRAAQGFGTVVYNGTLTEMAGASSSLFSEPLLSSSTGEPRHDDKLLSERAATRLNPSEPPKKKVRKSPELAIDLCNPMAHDNDVPLSEFVWTEIMDELEVFDELVLPGYQSSPPVASFLPATGTVSATSVQQLPTPFPSDAALEKVHGVLQQVDVEDKAPLFPPQDAWMLLDDEDLEMRIVRAPFPSQILDRSPVIGVSANTVLRTCFRVGEALNTGCNAVRNNRDVALELYARVTSSWREPNSVKQHLVFTDLYNDRPPYISGTYELWKGVELWDYDSSRFLVPLEGGRLCRCIGRMRRDGSKWKLTVLHIWEATWEDIDYAAGIYSGKAGS